MTEYKQGDMWGKDICAVCCVLLKSLNVPAPDLHCSYCWGPIVVDTECRPFPFRVLWPEDYPFGRDLKRNPGGITFK